MFHVSELRRFIPNDKDLFPSRDHPRPGPIVTEDGLEEHVIDCILDEWRCGRGYQYLIRWVGFSKADDEWLPQHQVEDCEALDVWLQKKLVDVCATKQDTKNSDANDGPVRAKRAKGTRAPHRVEESVSLLTDLQVALSQNQPDNNLTDILTDSP